MKLRECDLILTSTEAARWPDDPTLKKRAITLIAGRIAPLTGRWRVRSVTGDLLSPLPAYTYNKPAGFYPEERFGRYCCDVAECDHFASWKEISGPDHEQELRWLCQMHKGILEEEGSS